MVTYAAPSNSPTVVFLVRYRVTRATGANPVLTKGDTLALVPGLRNQTDGTIGVAVARSGGSSLTDGRLVNSGTAQYCCNAVWVLRICSLYECLDHGIVDGIALSLIRRIKVSVRYTGLVRRRSLKSV